MLDRVAELSFCCSFFTLNDDDGKRLREVETVLSAPMH